MNRARVSGQYIATMGGGHSKNIKKKGGGSYGTVYEFHGGVIKFVCEDPENEAVLFTRATGHPSWFFHKDFGRIKGAIIFPEAFYMTLRELDRRKPNFCSHKKRALFMSLLKQLKEVHSRGVFHCDIHAGNIMANFDLSRLVLVDFGSGFTLDEGVDIQIYKENDIRALSKTYTFWKTRALDSRGLDKKIGDGEKEFIDTYNKGDFAVSSDRVLRSAKRKKTG